MFACLVLAKIYLPTYGPYFLKMFLKGLGKQHLNIRALAGLVVPYPTLSEVGKRAAMTYFMLNLTNPWVQRIIGALRRLG